MFGVALFSLALTLLTLLTPPPPYSRLDSYRDLLDQWQCWVQRAQLDVSRQAAAPIRVPAQVGRDTGVGTERHCFFFHLSVDTDADFFCCRCLCAATFATSASRRTHRSTGAPSGHRSGPTCMPVPDAASLSRAVPCASAVSVPRSKTCVGCRVGGGIFVHHTFVCASLCP